MEILRSLFYVTAELDLSRCKHEYLDLYSEVQNPDSNELINSPFGGRFCGLIPPRSRISLYRTIAFSFYTDKNETAADIFTGRYAFINDCKYTDILPEIRGVMQFY